MKKQDTRVLGAATVNRVFYKAKSQSEYIIGLHKEVLDLFDITWDDVKLIDGYIKIGTAGHEKLFEKAITFDQRFHKDKLAAGFGWMNRGFSLDSSLAATRLGWEVTIPKIVMA